MLQLLRPVGRPCTNPPSAVQTGFVVVVVGHVVVVVLVVVGATVVVVVLVVVVLVDVGQMTHSVSDPQGLLAGALWVSPL